MGYAYAMRGCGVEYVTRPVSWFTVYVCVWMVTHSSLPSRHATRLGFFYIYRYLLFRALGKGRSDTISHAMKGYDKAPHTT